MAVGAARILETLMARLSAVTGVDTVTEQTDLVSDLGLDSLQVMELLMEMEDAFDISIPVNVMAEVRTVGELAGAVQALLN
ncbi:MAG: hypothetical protein Kow0073_02080 [Immundisolibacter sp.]